MRLPLAFVFTLAFAASTPAAETPTKPLALLNGKDLAGWELTTSPAAEIGAVCHYTDNGVLAVAGKPIGFLATKTSYENYQLHAEWRWTGTAGNSGVLVHIASGPKDRQWPLCFQIQTKNKSAGDLLPMAGGTFAEPLTSAPGAATPQRARSGADSEKPVGEWNSCDIVCRGDTIEVSVNGVTQNKVTKVSPSAGKIGFQLEGVAYELRNIRIAPLQ
jgi:hypothetical protein